MGGGDIDNVTKEACFFCYECNRTAMLRGDQLLNVLFAFSFPVYLVFARGESNWFNVKSIRTLRESPIFVWVYSAA